MSFTIVGLEEVPTPKCVRQKGRPPDTRGQALIDMPYNKAMRIPRTETGTRPNFSRFARNQGFDISVSQDDEYFYIRKLVG